MTARDTEFTEAPVQAVPEDAPKQPDTARPAADRPPRPPKLPSGLSLVAVRDPTGSDAGRVFYLTGKVFGVLMSFEVGSLNDLKALFEGMDIGEVFSQFGVSTMTQAAFEQGHVVMGLVDEILGSRESLQSRVERDIHALGVESLPEWIRNSQKAVTLMAVGAKEGWSANETWAQLAKTSAFKQRFGKSFGSIAEQMGVDDPLTVVNEILQQEASIRASIREYRGPGAEDSTGYLQRLLGRGWSAGEVDSLLSAEKRLREAPGALRNLNQILRFQGGRELRAADLTRLMTGNAPAEVSELVSDALRRAALSAEGIKISARFASALGSGEGSDLGTDFAAGAQSAARAILDFGLELDAGKYGLKRNDIIRAAFGEGATEDVKAALEKFSRERSQAAQGLGGRGGYVGAEGELRVQGLGGL